MIASNGGGAGASAAADSTHPESRRERYDWDRLENAVHSLVEVQQGLRKERDSLREALGAREDRIQTLEAKLIEANQLRQDTAKRIDELIAQLDQLDEQLAALEPA